MSGGSGGSGGAITFETPVGTINGINKTFTVTNTPVFIVEDGVTYFNGQGYTLAGLTITFDNAPVGFLQSAYSTSGSIETPTGTVNGSNVTFIVVNNPVFIISDGVTYFQGNGYSMVGLTVTMDFAPTSFIRSFYGSGTPTSLLGAQVPTGLINSSNVTYTLVVAPRANSLLLYLNGQLQIPTVDYILSGLTITFTSPPDTGSTLFANYQY